MVAAQSFFSLTYNDNTVKSNGEPESSNVEFPVQTLDEAGWAAEAALLATLGDTTTALTIGVLAKTRTVARATLDSTLPAASSLSQRENKWLVRYHGATTQKKFRLSIPTADLSHLATHSEFIAMGTGVGLAFKNAFEAVGVSPDDASEAIVVDTVQFVGRNS